MLKIKLIRETILRQNIIFFNSFIGISLMRLGRKKKI